MTGTAALTARRSAARFRGFDTVCLALLAYVPFLLSSPGKVSADTKQYLYLDPGRFLSRAASLWDPHVAAGTVPHQQIGYLFPMGPYFWLTHAVGMPDWIAQRLWLGTISLLAALGARWLFRMLGARRVGALTGAVLYMLTPYQLAFTARISVLLLAWAGLPWLVGLTIRALREGGWRDPALIALVILAMGSVNASSMLFMLVAPALWILVELAARRVAWRVVAATLARIGVLTLGVSLWWIIGLRIQGVYGLPVLQLTESTRVVSSASTPDDLLRGLGNWYFYGADQLGYALDQARYYVSTNAVIVLSYAVPVLALVAAGVLRWRHRAFLILLVVTGVVIGVGAWPYDDQTLYGRVWAAFTNGSSVGLALRNTPRVVPVIVLGLAGLVAGAVSGLAGRSERLVAAGVVGLVVFGAFAPVWRQGYLSGSVERPEAIPSYWENAAAALTREGDATRVLEIPGANFSAYRWGNTIEPVTTGLTDRPVIAREVLPYGSPQTVNLLDALDRRMQEGTFEPASLAPVARLLSSGTVLLRSDLQYERFGLPRPRSLWDQLAAPTTAPGLEAPKAFGPTTTNASSIPLVDALTLRDAGKADPPAVALFGVQDPVPIVHAAPSERPVVVDGDGDGIVDAAAAGLIDGNQLVQQTAAMTDTELRAALARGADLVVTDSNRRRAETWFGSLRDDKGATERAGQTLPDPNDEDFRLNVFPGTGDSARTVVEQDGGTVDASADGGTTRPEDRAVRAFDGDLRTAWRVGGADPTGQELVLRPTHGVRTDHVTLVQPQNGPRDRVLTRASVQVDDQPPIDVDLGPDSLTPAGQVVRFPTADVNRLTIRTLATSTPAIDPAQANPVGFAEVELGGVKVTETVRLPVDLAQRVDGRASGHNLDLVMSRLRYDPSDAGHQDQELALHRRVVLPDARAFGLSGTVRVDPNAPDDTIDRVLGTTAPGTTFQASSHLVGDADTRASRAFDDDPATAWTAAIGPQVGQYVGADLSSPTTVDQVTLGVVADGQHSVPRRLRLQVDGADVRTLDLPPISTAGPAGHATDVTLSFPAVTGRNFRLVVDQYDAVDPDGSTGVGPQTLPVGFTQVGLAGVPVPSAPASVPGACRDDLVRVDGSPIPVRVTGAPADARRGLALEACGGPLRLSAGSHTVTSATGLDGGLDVDRIVLSSDRSGAATTAAPRGAPLDTSGAQVRVTNSGSTHVTLHVRTDGKPFWLVFGQSHNSGWEASSSSGIVGPHRLVDGYANGWLVRPSRAGTLTIDLRWTPQRLVWLGFAVSGVALVACIAILVVAHRRRRASAAAALGVHDDLGVTARAEAHWPTSYGPASSSVRRNLGAAAAIGVNTAICSRPWIGLTAAAVTFLVGCVPRARPFVVAAIPALLAASRLWHRPALAWLAIALLVTDLVGLWLHRRRADVTPSRTSAPSLPEAEPRRA